MKPFKPVRMEEIKLDFIKIMPLIVKANSALSNYNGALKHFISPQILLAPMTAKEATLSTQIEGTQATLSEVYLHEAGEDFVEYKRQDIKEVNNYKTAMAFAVEKLKERPFIHLNMLKEIHNILLDGVRGKNKGRGEFRRLQNWIGTKESTIDTATYVPPAPNDVLPFLDNWEKFINSDYVDLLTQLSLMHAQFEIIHPFLDGNGRLGRILIPIFLFQKKYLDMPVFYLSEYLESKKDDYYRALNKITSDQDWQGWVKFFLEAIIVQSGKNLIKIKEIMDLYEKTKAKITAAIKSSHSQNVLDILFKQPIITSTQLGRQLNIPSKTTVNSMLQRLERQGVVKLIRQPSGNRAGMYAFADIINLMEDKKVF